MNISITNLKRTITFKRLLEWFVNHALIEVTHDGDIVCEIHPPGTGERLAELEANIALADRLAKDASDDDA